MKDVMSFNAAVSAYLREPVADNWLPVRAQIVGAPGFGPNAGVNPAVGPMLAGGEYRRAIDYIESRMPAQFLNPMAHVLLATAHRRLGDDRRADAQLRLARIAHHAIADSGDGSAQAPYHVLRVEDEYGFLQVAGLISRVQYTRPSPLGGVLDVHDCGTGNPVYFSLEEAR